MWPGFAFMFTMNEWDLVTIRKLQYEASLLYCKCKKKEIEDVLCYYESNHNKLTIFIFSLH